MMPDAARYFVTDLTTENMTEIRLEMPPEIVGWIAVCQVQHFTGKTRDAAEQAMLRYMERTTPYRGRNMVGKHIGYQVYACDSKSRCYPIMGVSQGLFSGEA